MNEQNYTSLELSKKLAENGFEGESEFTWEPEQETGEYCLFSSDCCYDWIDPIPAYDILNDLCVRYAKEMFGEALLEDTHTRDIGSDWAQTRACKMIPRNILVLLQQGRKQEAEDYIWEHCLFNPENKEIPCLDTSRSESVKSVTVKNQSKGLDSAPSIGSESAT